MPKFRISVNWLESGVIRVEAENLKAAIKKVKDHVGDYPLPDGDYIDESFTVDEEGTELIYEFMERYKDKNPFESSGE